MFGIRASPYIHEYIFLLEKRRDLMSTPFKMGNKFWCKIPLNLKK
jgi:hypothetical protein